MCTQPENLFRTINAPNLKNRSSWSKTNKFLTLSAEGHRCVRCWSDILMNNEHHIPTTFIHEMFHTATSGCSQRPPLKRSSVQQVGIFELLGRGSEIVGIGPPLWQKELLFSACSSCSGVSAENRSTATTMSLSTTPKH